ncbi:MAG TPA: nitroreductase family deazaflavin-dependent oxidoreductase [Acidimicrobiia bacterium]|nr:nitroreductase family deazaflavin-dependent oxidoreductase [Acidimicrobiia bacterium]
MSDYNTKIIDEFRANAGKVEGFDAFEMLLLHTTGAKTGAERVNPLAFRREGDDLVVFASYAGRPKHPMWFHNLVANPDVEVELGTETFSARARVAEGDERTRIWEAQKAEVPQFAEYEQKADREIPVIVLERA